MRLTKEQKLAKLEADLARHKRKLRMETVPGVKEALFLARALRKWNDEFGPVETVQDAIVDLESKADDL